MFKKLLLSVLAVFGFTFLLSGDSFADSPSYTISSTPSSNIILCSNDSPSSSVLSIACSDYLYVNAEITGTASTRLQLWTTVNSNYPISSSVMSTFSVKMPSTLSYVMISTSGNDFSGGGSITFSFSDTPIGSSGIIPSGSLNITQNGTYDVTNYASAVVYVPEGECEDCDTPFIVSLFKDSFWGIITACVSLIVPILALFLIFRLVHDWLWGKG